MTSKKAFGGEGKTARACDSCVKRRARWYCAADDAFLCQACDTSVHSANSLAGRHHRVRLNTLSSDKPQPPSPAWHRGFTTKPRTPRPTNAKPTNASPVPEISTDDVTDDHLLYRVPVFDPLVAELCVSNTNSNNNSNNNNDAFGKSDVFSSSVTGKDAAAMVSPKVDLNEAAFLPSEMDLEEFAADVESLLGRGLEDECDFGIEGLGFVECDTERDCFDSSAGLVKIEIREDEEEQEENDDMKICWSEISADPLELNFDDYEDSPAPSQHLKIEPDQEEEEGGEEDQEEGEEDELKNGEKSESSGNMKKKNKKKKKKKKRKKIVLSLDYEGVITAWASQGSPWTTGDRPDVDLDSHWPDCLMDTYTDNQFNHQTSHHHYMHMNGGIGGTPMILTDGSREARVSRYREKRRTRLFSKKIRYEVRKLNAEKRPRMKGRFVKRASFVAPHFPLLK